MRKKPVPKKRVKPVDYFFIGHGRDAAYEIFKDNKKMPLASDYPQYFGLDGPFPNYESAMRVARLQGYRNLR